MDCCGLSSSGLQDIDANDIIADNMTILSNLNYIGTTNLNNSLNVHGVQIGFINNKYTCSWWDKINFINIQLTVDATGLVICNPALEHFLLIMMDGIIYGIDLINYFMLCLIPHTVLLIMTLHIIHRICEQDIVNQIYYPRQIQLRT